jgi:hypothetical protein
MIVEKKEKFTVLKPSTNFKDFYSQFIEKLIDYKKENLILDFSELKIQINELLQFKNTSEEQLNNEISFIIINNDIDLDEVPDEIIIVPTFQEAIDVIEMDEMTRELGI